LCSVGAFSQSDSPQSVEAVENCIAQPVALHSLLHLFSLHLFSMTDSELQAALTQSKMFDLNQVKRRPTCYKWGFFFPFLKNFFSETHDFHAISGRFQTSDPGAFLF
jgi:hypothetical protein